MELEAAIITLASVGMTTAAQGTIPPPNAGARAEPRNADLPDRDRLSEAIETIIQAEREQARAEGLREGAEAAHTLWRRWLADYRDAELLGKPFPDATPDGIEYAALRPGRHSEECNRRRGTRRPHREIPDYACETSKADHYEGRGGQPKPGATCPACHNLAPPTEARHGQMTSCRRCGARMIAYGNSLTYWYDLAHYARNPELARQGTAPCVTNAADEPEGPAESPTA